MRKDKPFGLRNCVKSWTSINEALPITDKITQPPCDAGFPSHNSHLYTQFIALMFSATVIAKHSNTNSLILQTYGVQKGSEQKDWALSTLLKVKKSSTFLQGMSLTGVYNSKRQRSLSCLPELQMITCSSGKFMQSTRIRHALKASLQGFRPNTRCTLRAKSCLPLTSPIS
jgi:hypothetical protein